MYHFMSRATAVALLAVATFALAANGDAPSNNGANQDKKQQNDRGDKNNKNQAPSNKGATKDSAAQSQPAKKQDAREAKQADAKKFDKNSPDQADSIPSNQNQLNQNQLNQNNSDPSNRNAATLQQSSAAQLGTQNNAKNPADGGDTQGQSLIAREHSSMRPTDMRGPDIGLWFGGGTNDGLVISDVAPRGAISQLGFHEGDRIVSVNRHRISREPDFINYLFGGNSNRVEVIVTRDGREQSIFVEPNTLTAGFGVAQVEPLEQFGVVLDDRYDDRVVVWRVFPRSPAYYAGIREGDVISTLGGQPYTARSEFETSVRGLKAGATNLQVRRGEKTRDRSVNVPDFEQGPRSADWRAKNEGGGRRVNAWPDSRLYMNQGGERRDGR
jgi:C-terminal processing protease CtpA/Prc